MPQRELRHALKRRKEDALALARLVYDIYKEENASAKIKTGGQDVKARDRNSAMPGVYTRAITK